MEKKCEFVWLTTEVKLVFSLLTLVWTLRFFLHLQQKIFLARPRHGHCYLQSNLYKTVVTLGVTSLTSWSLKRVNKPVIRGYKRNIHNSTSWPHCFRLFFLPKKGLSERRLNHSVSVALEWSTFLKWPLIRGEDNEKNNNKLK